MSDNLRPDDDLDHQETFMGEREAPEGIPRSLGDQATTGDALSSISDPSGEADDLGDEMPLVDLSERYEIQELLGKGGMGEVFLALDTRLKRPVAIKRVHGDMARSTKALSRFLTEAQSIAQLDHENIIDVYDYGRDQDGPFLIMQFVAGGSLLDRCREGALAMEEAIDMTCQLCDALQMAHSRGIIHRDIKPANILLTEAGIPKLTDFGLARHETADHGQTQVGAILGTIDFMPPEQRRDATSVDARSDLWSLAATCYQMLTGKSPKIIRFDLVPSELTVVLGKALEEEQADRYQTAVEFRDALRGCPVTEDIPALEDVNLGLGECPACGVSNDSSRKFCCECAEPLRVPCLSCGVQIPIWEKVCSECGGKQADLVEARSVAMDAQRVDAESLRGQLAFDQAIRIAEEVAAVEESRLQHLKEWSATFLDSIRTEKNREEQKAENHYQEARKHRQAFDYKSAIQAMEMIPEEMRTSEMGSYLQELHSDHDESKSLIQTILERVKRRDLDGLLVQVTRALELSGDRSDLIKLQSQLSQHNEKMLSQRDSFYSKAEDLLSQGQAKAAWEKIQQVKATELRPSDLEFKTRVESIVQKEDELASLVAGCKADGLINPGEVCEMLPKAIEYLQINPNHKTIQDMRDELLERVRREPERHVLLMPNDLLSYLPGDCFLGMPADFMLTLPPIENSIGMQLKMIPAGTFYMGSSPGEYKKWSNHPAEIKQTRVTIDAPFLIGQFPVTQRDYEKVMEMNPSKFNSANNPVENVKWEDAVEFCSRLSSLPEEYAAGRVYRLPGENEWEYACRSGTTTEYSFGNECRELVGHAWFSENSGNRPLDLNLIVQQFGNAHIQELWRNGCRTHEVGTKPPNPWGLYDMHGNVTEMCFDFSVSYSSTSFVDRHVVKGGSYISHPANCRSAYRRHADAKVLGSSAGFRVFCSFVR